ncbi:sigma-70 family RNA polymerase sigma factor [Enterococcus sp. LJL128]
MIVKLIKDQNFKGLELLIDHLGKDILKTIYSILDRPEERDYRREAENEVFYKLWKKMNHYNATKSSLKTWVLTITKNTCIDKKRSLVKMKNLLPIEDAANLGTCDAYFEKEHFLELVAQLKKEDQLIFLKYYYYQQTPQEIAASLGLTADQVYNHLSRGRKKLKSILKQ